MTPDQLQSLRSLLLQPQYAGLTDAAAATLASTPIRTAVVGSITYETLTTRVGVAVVAALINGIEQKIAVGGPDAGAYKLADKALGNKGFEAGNPQAAEVVGLLLRDGLVAAEQAERAQYDVSWACGFQPTATDVAAARAANQRQADADALAHRVTAVQSRFLNEVLHPAAAGSGPLPTWADFVAAVGAG